MIIKNKVLTLLVSLLFTGFTLQACFDYDTPGDEFVDKETQIIQPPVISSGKADSINYKINISDKGVKAAYKAIRTQLKSAQTGLYAMRGGKEGGAPEAHAYQILYALGPDCYAQYSCVTHNNFPYTKDGILRSTYDVSKAFNGGPGGGFAAAKLNIAPALNIAEIDSLPELKALYLIFYNYAAIENADLFGPFPYIDHKNLKEKSPFKYNDLRTIYYKAKENIDSAINCLKYYAGTHKEMVKNQNGTIEEKEVPNRSPLYKKTVYRAIDGQIPLLKLGELKKENLDIWIHFANSLKLRMAIHLTEVEPETAKKWAEEAVESGVIENTNEEVAAFVTVSGKDHPLVEMAGWRDNVITASFLSLLQSLNHPYLTYLFTKNEIDIENTGHHPASSAPDITKVATAFVGMRAGATPGEGQAPASNPYAGFTAVNKQYIIDKKPPLYFMKLSEVYFLRAEGALRGWNMKGTAKEFYEKGIRCAYFEDRSFESEIAYPKLVDEYLKRTQPKEYTYVDPTGKTPDMPSVTKIGVNWDAANGDKAKLLEMIITQKYIASWPYSYEAFVDLRRLGYPKLFPILNVKDGDGTIKEGNPYVQTWDNLIRRIPWAADDPQVKVDIADTGIPALAKDAGTADASDTQMQRLWWDKGSRK